MQRGKAAVVENGCIRHFVDGLVDVSGSPNLRGYCATALSILSSPFFATIMECGGIPAMQKSLEFDSVGSVRVSSGEALRAILTACPEAGQRIDPNVAIRTLHYRLTHDAGVEAAESNLLLADALCQSCAPMFPDAFADSTKTWRYVVER